MNQMEDKTMDNLGKDVKFASSVVIKMGGKEQEVRELALKIFKRTFGFTFKPDVDEAIVDKLVESESFQKYIKEAEKQLEKREQALANNKMYSVIDVPADGKKGVAGGAYCLCFVYSKYRGNFVLKGYHREVEKYLKKNYTHYFYNMSMQWMGGHRDFWGFWKESIGIYEPSRYKKDVNKKDMKFRIRPYGSWSYDVEEQKNEMERREKETLSFKRIPKRWIPEFDKF